MSNFKKNILVFIFLFLISFLTYLILAHHLPLMSDDFFFLTEAKYYSFQELFRHSFWSRLPISISILKIFTIIAPQNDLIIHYFFLVLHSINAFLLFLLLKKLTNQKIFAPLVGAIFFLIYPVHNEAIFWIATNLRITQVFFILLAFLLLLKYYEKNKLNLIFLSVLFYLSSVLCYEDSTVLFLIIPLLNYFVGNLKIKRSLIIATPYFFSVAAWHLFRYINFKTFANVAGYGISFNVKNIFLNLNTLFQQLLTRVSSADVMLPDAYNVLFKFSINNKWTILSIFLGLIISAILLKIASRESEDCEKAKIVFPARRITVFGLLFLLSISPYIFLANQAPQTRYSYLPSLSITILLCLLFQYLFDKFRHSKKVLYFLIGVVFLSFSYFIYFNYSEILLNYKTAKDFQKVFFGELDIFVNKNKINFESDGYPLLLIANVPNRFGTSRSTADWAMNRTIEYIYDLKKIRLGVQDKCRAVGTTNNDLSLNHRPLNEKDYSGCINLSQKIIPLFWDKDENKLMPKRYFILKDNVGGNALLVDTFQQNKTVEISSLSEFINLIENGNLDYNDILNPFNINPIKKDLAKETKSYDLHLYHNIPQASLKIRWQIDLIEKIEKPMFANFSLYHGFEKVFQLPYILFDNERKENLDLKDDYVYEEEIYFSFPYLIRNHDIQPEDLKVEVSLQEFK